MVYYSKKLRVANSLKEYLKCRNTKVQSHNKASFMTYNKPFRAAAIDSMRGWVKELFIVTSMLKEHTPHTNSIATQ